MPTKRKYTTVQDLADAGVEDPRWFVAMQQAANLRDEGTKALARRLLHGIPAVHIKDFLDELYEDIGDDDQTNDILTDEIAKWNKSRG